MKTPFDPQEMPGADERAKRLDAVASAIAQAKLLSTYAKFQALEIETSRLLIQPVKPGNITMSESLARQHYDLQALQGILKTYQDGLVGWQRGEKQQHQANMFLDPPPEVTRYVQAIKDNVSYVAPVKTGS